MSFFMRVTGKRKSKSNHKGYPYKCGIKRFLGATPRVIAPVQRKLETPLDLLGNVTA
jgi:hypothetical protein